MCRDMVQSLLNFKRTQCRWLGHLAIIPSRRSPGEGLLPCPARRRTCGRPQTSCRDCVSWLGWKYTSIFKVTAEREACCLQSWIKQHIDRCLPFSRALLQVKVKSFDFFTETEAIKYANVCTALLKSVACKKKKKIIALWQV